MNFSQVLRNSLSVEKTTPAFCETCKKFTPTNQYARVTELPQILSINCGLTNDKEMNFLRKQMNRNSSTTPNTSTNNVEPIPNTTISTPNAKPCRYGNNCSRVDCHFAHSDRKSPAVGSSNGTTNTNGNSSSNRPNTWFPHQFTMEIDESTSNLKVISSNDPNNHETVEVESENISSDNKNVDDLDVSSITITDDTESSTDAEKTSKSMFGDGRTYKLTAVVCQILNGNQSSLVALIYVGERYHKAKIADYDSETGQWYIFNDFR